MQLKSKFDKHSYKQDFFFVSWKPSIAPFTKAPPVIRIRIKIAFTKSELFTFYEHPLNTHPRKGGWACREKVTFDLNFEIICIIVELCSQITNSAPDADIMRIIAASKSVDYSAPIPILRPDNEDNIRIIEFMKGVHQFPSTGTRDRRKWDYHLTISLVMKHFMSWQMWNCTECLITIKATCCIQGGP